MAPLVLSGLVSPEADRVSSGLGMPLKYTRNKGKSEEKMQKKRVRTR